MSEKLKLKFVHWLEKISPHTGCWCNRVMWALGYEDYSFWDLFRGAKVCKEGAKTHDWKACYCGKYNFNPPLTEQEAKEEKEAFDKLVGNKENG